MIYRVKVINKVKGSLVVNDQTGQHFPLGETYAWITEAEMSILKRLKVKLEVLEVLPQLIARDYILIDGLIKREIRRYQRGIIRARKAGWNPEAGALGYGLQRYKYLHQELKGVGKE